MENNNIFIDNLKIILEKEYLIYVQKFYKSLESTVGNVYIIETNDNKYVIKIYDSLSQAKKIINIHEYLIQFLKVPRIINNKKNNSYIKLNDNKIMVLFSFLDGYQINKIIKSIDDEIIIKIAKYLRKLHELSIVNNSSNFFKIKKSPIKVSKIIDRQALLHFDFTSLNIFYNEENKEIGLIDFDDMKFGQAIIDVSIAVCNLFFSKTRGENLSGVKIFIDNYYGKDLDLKNKEILYIKECVFKWINYILNENEFDSSTKESLEVKRDMILKVDFEKLIK